MNVQKKWIGLFASVVLVCCHVQACATSEVRTAVHDSVITGKIKAKLLGDKEATSFVTVETKDGVVFLKGDVATDCEANAAIEIASSTEGVVDVDTSHLTVRVCDHPLADAMITAKVKGTYVREKVMDNRPTSVAGIHVETRDGIVYLSGKVEKTEQANQAVKLAKSVKGVKKVESNIQIKKR